MKQSYSSARIRVITIDNQIIATSGQSIQSNLGVKFADKEFDQEMQTSIW